MLKMNYSEILDQLDGLIETGETTIIRRYGELANTSALLALHLKQINWVGFYLVETPAELILGPFQGAPACTPIQFGKGVCGTAWREKRTIVVPDVRTFEGHIACDARSLSEVVVPIFSNEHVVAVLDVDSPVTNRFTQHDIEFLEAVGKMVSRLFPNHKT